MQEVEARTGADVVARKGFFPASSVSRCGCVKRAASCEWRL
jgi:hypothetical protein